MDEDEIAERRNRNRIIGDKVVMLYTLFLWICYFAAGDPFIWAHSLGISGLFLGFVMYLSYGLGFLATILMIFLVFSGTKHAWKNMN
jgi:hypothetical protein